MAKSKKTEAAQVADEPVPTNPIETAAKPKRKKQPAVDPGTDPDGWVDVQSAPELRKISKPKTAAKTLATIFAGYLQALDERGGSTGTIASYRMELEMAGEALGVDTPVTDMTPDRVLAFFTSDPVTKKHNGKPKSSLSIDKTRRVLRQALVWAGHADLVPSMEVAS